MAGVTGRRSGTRAGALVVFALALALAGAAPAAAEPRFSGDVSGSAPFEWSGGPLSGMNAVGEPCNTTHQCEDILLNVTEAGRLQINWKAEAPGDQSWLGATLYKSDEQGTAGDQVADGGAFDSEGALAVDVQPGYYLLTMSALLSVNATYDATATLTPGSGGPSGPAPPPPPTDPDWYVDAGADWTQAYIDEPDGTRLHADILRPKGLAPDVKTPVILSIGPYFNHSGQVGAAGPAQGAAYRPFGPVGPSERFADLAVGADIFAKGYTLVLVDLRGFGGSSGCLDWAGPGEQADVVAAVEWAAQQPWSTGKVGMYGKSYDGVTGLLGEILQPEGLEAVVAQEPVYDLYRYLYANGVRYLNSVATPALYDAIEATPGTIEDDAEYHSNGANNTAHPGCELRNWAEQQDSNHDSDYWKARDLIAKASNGRTPLFMTQGFLENNTKPDGTWDFFNAVDAPKRAWFGMFDHVRGNDRDESGRLAMGREGWFDEVMRFYDRYLKGIEPDVEDPTLAIQTNDGTWRAEEQWPPADSKTLTVPLNEGEYTDDTEVRGTSDGLGRGDTGVGVWTISRPLPHDAHIAGVPRLKVDLETQAPNANLVGAVYDIDEENNATLIHRQAHLLPEGGTYEFDLYGNDWMLPAGHRIGVLLTTSNNEWWQLAMPTYSTVTVTGGTLTLPFLQYKRDEHIQGGRAIRLDNYLANAPFELEQEAIDEGESEAFPFPPALTDAPAERPPGGGDDPGQGGGAGQAGSGATATAPTASGTPAVTGGRAQRRTATSRTLVATARRRGRALVIAGRAPSGRTVTIRLRRGKRTVAVKRVRARRGAFRAVFRLRRAGLYRALVTTTADGKRLNARTRLVRLR